MNTENLKYPKPKYQKKRKKHKSTILHKKDGTCYLCIRLHNDYRIHRCVEDHHIFFGKKNKRHSEEEGLRVYLCLEHHRTGPEAVHTNKEVRRILQQDGQKAYEKTHTRKEFMSLFGENYL